VRKAPSFYAVMLNNLTFLWRPTIGFGARAAHQHRSLMDPQTMAALRKDKPIIVAAQH
jgi:hypothetical protein